VDALFVGSLSSVHRWQDGQWLILAPGVAGMPAARPTEMFNSDISERATERAAAVVARAMEFRTPGGEPGVRPRFFLVDQGPHDPTTEEHVERVDVSPRIYLRDATEDFPSPIPRFVRVVAMMTTVHVSRRSADPGRAGHWMSEPILAMETVSPGAAQTRMLDVFEAQLLRMFAITVSSRR
jgi:hypothetical protein